MKKLIFVLVLFLLLPLRIFAYTGSASLECSSNEVKPNDTFTCAVKISSSDDIAQVRIPITLDSNLSLTGFTFTDAVNWQGNDVTNGIIDSYAADPVHGNFTLGTLSFKVASGATAGSTSIVLNNMVFSMDFTQYSNISNHTKTLTITNGSGSGSGSGGGSGTGTDPQPAQTGLKSLTSPNGVFSPTLSSDNFTYLLTLSSASVNAFSINAVAKNATDSITAKNADTNESINLSNITFKTSGGNSSMSIKIMVGSVNYTVNVTKPTASNVGNPILTSLKVGNKTVTLVSNKQDYTVELDDVSSYKIVATLEDSTNYKFSDSTVAILSPNSVAGEKIFTIQVVPKNSGLGLTSSTYVITVSKTAQHGGDEPTNPSGGNSGGSSGGNSQNGGNTNTNPSTSGKSAIVMGAILVASLVASVFLYRKNMKQYN